MSADAHEELELRIDRWRTYVLARGEVETQVAVVEVQLRDHAARLGDAGLDAGEAFLVALRRVAVNDEASRDFARAYSDELWIMPAEIESEEGLVSGATTEFWAMLGCAVAAAVAIKVPTLFGYEFSGSGGFYARNLSLFVLPFLAAYFIWKCGPSKKGIGAVAGVFVAGAVFANVYPFTPDGSTEVLTAIHLPIVLWLTVGVRTSRATGFLMRVAWSTCGSRGNGSSPTRSSRWEGESLSRSPWVSSKRSASTSRRSSGSG